MVIWNFGASNQAQQADCIIVLGAAVNGNKASPVFEERIRHAINIYNSGFAKKIIFTGGLGDGKSHSESAVAAVFAREQGVPVADILIEERSRTTQSNLSEAYELMQAEGFGAAILVSDPLHMKRATLMAEGLGMAVFSSPTPSSRYTGFNSQLKFLLREIYFVHHYWFVGR